LSISICRPTELTVGAGVTCPMARCSSYGTKPQHSEIYSLQLKRCILLFFNKARFSTIYSGIIKSSHSFFYLRSPICFSDFTANITFKTYRSLLDVIRFLFGCYSVVIRFVIPNNKRATSTRMPLFMLSKPYNITNNVLLIFKIHPPTGVLTSGTFRNVLFTA